ncbi:MAG TPA: hypothetical protein VIY48_13265 [Candidatus Paceibacterota bacterium]
MDTSFSIEAKYSRTKQVAQYEPATAEIKTVFSVDAADAEGLMDQALDKCKAAVERVLGLRPAVAGSPTVDRAASKTPEPTTAQMPEDTPKRRGRPTKEEAAKKAATEALKRASTEDVMADLINEDEPQNIQAGPEDRNDPMADLMGDAPKPEVKKITDQELQNAAGKANLRLGDPRVIKKYVNDTFGVAKLHEVPMERRQELIDGLANLKKDGTVG